MAGTESIKPNNVIEDRNGAAPRGRKSRSDKPPTSVLENDSRSCVPSSTVDNRSLVVRGARIHNLKNITIGLDRNRLIVITGVSGSGKSSLAFNTIYAEGQRRYVESLSAYARQFLARMAKPDVDSISGLAPAIAIEQRTTARNPRSTVATTTEVYDYLRLLYARIGKMICYKCGKEVSKDTPRVIQQWASELPEETRIIVLFPMPGHHKRTLAQEFDTLRERGFFRVIVGSGGNIVDLNATYPQGIDKGDIHVVIDRIVVRDDDGVRGRIADAAEVALREGNGRAAIHLPEREEWLHFSSRYECAGCEIRYEEPHPKLFSFNSPFGACPDCQGFGRAIGVDLDLVIPDRTRSLRGGAITAFSTPKHAEHHRKLMSIARITGLGVDKPVSQISSDEWDIVMKGSGEYIGIEKFFKWVEEQSYKMHYRVFLSRYRGFTTCSRCRGSRLRTSAMQVFVHGKSIPDIVQMTIEEGAKWFDGLNLSEYEHAVARRVLAEIRKRITFLNDVGLGYLRLDRLTQTLSGGEAQRINLATSIGSSLVGAMYVLDEPSIGLHPRDTERLIRILKSLRDLGNTVIVVEHDSEIIGASDVVVEMGPGAGESGGDVVFVGTVQEMRESAASGTGAYLSGRTKTAINRHRRPRTGRSLTVHGASENNLRDLTVEFPLEMLTVVTGVSGSGKSTLVHEILYPALVRAKGIAMSASRRFRGIEGDEYIGGVEMVDQTPIGRSSRSNPVTYVKAFDAIRDLFSQTSTARVNGWKPGYFSFNVPGGRCEACQGEGVVHVEMQFLADIELQCEACHGSRYKAETLTASYHGMNIVNVLSMTIREALEFFSAESRIVNRLKPLDVVGLGYLRLGQPATTLSGGEAQRVKLAAHLSGGAQERTLFVMDEPTTGLHFADIATLLRAFDALLEAGHSLVVVEHNLEVIKAADWVVDLGPEAGAAGGRIVASGRPEDVARSTRSHTGHYLRREFDRLGGPSVDL